MNIAELQREAVRYAPEIKRIKEVFHKVAAKEQIGAEYAAVVKVATDKEYIRFSARAGRHMFTPKGQGFYKAMRRFG